MIDISLRNLYKAYEKDKMVIKGISLEIFEDEFLVFVGPSGCGKTTTLRMIAGLEEITDGKLYFNDVLQNDLDPSSRNLSFVFQNYALLPYFTVYDNIEFGLAHMKLDRLTKKKMVEAIAKKLGLYDKLGSYISNLSGGQRQRVALARALVDEKQLVLFDEPLSNLDAVLRSGMRKELMLFKKRFGVTSIYVTHDQIEAMSMGSRIVLLMDGHIIQVGTANQLYNEPINIETAKFIGSPEINLISGIYNEKHIEFQDMKIQIDRPNLESYRGKNLTLGIRPENVHLELEDKSKRSLKGEVTFIEQLGDKVIAHLEIGGMSLQAITQKNIKVNQTYDVRLDKIFIFDDSGMRITTKTIEAIYFKNFEPPEKIQREIINYGYEVLYKLSNENQIIYKVIQDSEGYTLYKPNQETVQFDKLEHIFKHVTYQKKAGAYNG